MIRGRASSAKPGLDNVASALLDADNRLRISGQPFWRPDHDPFALPTLRAKPVPVPAAGHCPVHAADAMIVWPAGWEVESLPTESGEPVQPSVQVRQRAVKTIKVETR